MIFKNLTEKHINITDGRGKVLHSLPPTTKPAFSRVVPNIAGYLKGIPIMTYEYKDPQNIPMPEKDTVFIVKYAVLRALNGAREYVVAPDTSPGSVSRDRITGEIKGIKAFQK